MPNYHGISAPNRVDALCAAAARNMIPALKALLADGADVDGVLSKSGGVQQGSSALHIAANRGALRAVDCLIEAGASLNPTDRNELTPLMCACNVGQTKGSAVALRLIEAGADVRYVRPGDEMTALKFAVHRCAPAVIQALIDHGAAVDGPRGTQQTALMLAARHDNVDALRVLVKNGARLSLKCKLPWAEGRTAEGVAELEKRKKALAYLRSLSTGAARG